ncbi:MAG: hypothetical protein R2873_10735 [Caldilineaceae bacterium]|nr:hypothetical protein [Caldilineaceae bacterium]
MATIALDPLLVAKINALLASMQSREEQEQFSTEDILELFETFLMEQSQRPQVSKDFVVRRSQPVREPM